MEIKPEAFCSCSNLTGTLSLPSTLEILGSNDNHRNGVFLGCGFVCELKLPEKLRVIGNRTFEACSCIYGELFLPSGIEFIGRSAFAGMSNVTGSITIPQGVKRKLTI